MKLRYVKNNIYLRFCRLFKVFLNYNLILYSITVKFKFFLYKYADISLHLI